MNGKDARALGAFVRGLSRPDRLILLLHYADDLTPIEIAALLRLPDTEVRERLAALRCRAAGQIARLAGRARGAAVATA